MIGQVETDDLSSGERTVVAELTELVGEGLVRQELLSGIKAPAQFESLRAALSPFPD